MSGGCASATHHVLALNKAELTFPAVLVQPCNLLQQSQQRRLLLGSRLQHVQRRNWQPLGGQDLQVQQERGGLLALAHSFLLVNDNRQQLVHLCRCCCSNSAGLC